MLHNSTVELAAARAASPFFFVIIVDGDNGTRYAPFPLAFGRNDTIQRVRTSIAAHIGEPNGPGWRLPSRGRMLEDGRTLSSYDIQRDEVLLCHE